MMDLNGDIYDVNLCHQLCILAMNIIMITQIHDLISFGLRQPQKMV